MRTAWLSVVSAVLLVDSALHGGTLFEADYSSGRIYEYNASGQQSVFAFVAPEIRCRDREAHSNSARHDSGRRDAAVFVILAVVGYIMIR